VVTANAYYIHPIVGDVARDLGVSAARIGLVPALNQFALALGILLLLPLGDRYANRTLTIVFTVGQCAGLVVMALAHGFVLFTAGSSCGALLPTGNAADVIAGVPCTLIDNGMPCVVLRADAVGITGYEDRDALDANADLKARIEAIRLVAGPLMNLGDVAEQPVPKMMLVAPPRDGGAITVRSFIPRRAHASVGVLGAVSVATACLIAGSPAAALAAVPDGSVKTLSVEHPTGAVGCVLTVAADGSVTSAALLRTARKLMDGVVFDGSDG
jgi:2-methylaconitate cis-trans-isomerase PrpF